MYEVYENDLLEVGTALRGRFIYMGIAQGMQNPCVLHSRSTNMKCKIGGIEGRSLKKGDCIPVINQTKKLDNLYLKMAKAPIYKKSIIILVVLGPADDIFSEEDLRSFHDRLY